MNSVWQMTPSERLKEWRSFRFTLDDMDDDECLQAVVDWWKLTPLGKSDISIYESKDWPDPWELLWGTDHNEDSIALGVAYTLALTGWPCEVAFIQCQEKSFLGLVVIVDEQHVLNYTYGCVDNISILDNCEIITRWHSDTLV